MQEEPENSGALWYLHHKFNIKSLQFVSREESSTPASGYYKNFKEEQEELLDLAFNIAGSQK